MRAVLGTAAAMTAAEVAAAARTAITAAATPATTPATPATAMSRRRLRTTSSPQTSAVTTVSERLQLQPGNYQTRIQ